MVADKVRVAVLGGGLGAISAAFRLTDPALNDRYAVTVYQQGWRLGGKAASGRNLERNMGARIEEHGLHMFMGWYDEAFRLMRDCYREWDAPPGHPYGTIAKAFIPQRSVTLAENVARPQQPPDWDFWTINFPHLPGQPGDERGELSPAKLLRSLVGWLAEPAAELGIDLPHPPDNDPTSRWAGHAVAHRIVGDAHPHHFGDLVELLEAAHRLLDDIGTEIGDIDRDLREAWTLLRLGFAIAKALAIDVVPYGHAGWQRVNHLDLKDWLASHGATTPEVSFSAPIRAFYDLAFAYLNGDTSRYENAQIAAGAAMRTMLMVAFAYRDAPMWRMTAGMGDVIFGPLYQVLERRGVTFEFFHRVTDLHLSGDSRLVESIDIDRQAAILDGGYQPLYKLGPMDVWPSQPLWDQIKNGSSLKADGVDFESAWDATCVEKRSLKFGTSYDAVVLGISLGGIPAVAQELLAADNGWQEMVDKIGTVQTQSVQLWTVDSLEVLGWTHGPLVGTAYAEPIDSFADMSQVLPQERWSGSPPLAVEYLCGPMRQLAADPYSDPLYPARAQATVVANASTFFTDKAAAIWPALSHAGEPAYDQLYAPSAASGEERLAFQYFRANINPSERYVLTPPDTVHLRLDPADCGFDNVFPAGDWVKTSVNGGSAEAAIEAGNLAAAGLVARFK